MNGTGAPWATLEDVRRMIEQSEVIDGACRTMRLRLVPPQETASAEESLRAGPFHGVGVTATDCPDSGPAKEAAPQPSLGVERTPAPQRGTATGALSRTEFEAREIALNYAASGCEPACTRDILALVKREREALIDRMVADARSAYGSETTWQTVAKWVNGWRA